MNSRKRGERKEGTGKWETFGILSKIPENGIKIAKKKV